MTKPEKSKNKRRYLMAAAGILLGAVLALAGCRDTRPTGGEPTGEVTTGDASAGTSGTAEPVTEPTTKVPVIPPFPEEVGAESGGESDGSGDGESDGQPGESGAEAGTEPEEPEDPRYDWSRRMIVATDMHYLAEDLTDGGSGFWQMVEHGDGKVLPYIGQIMDAFLEEVVEDRPDVLILSGDLTLDGEKLSHEELAEKLYGVEDEGIPVLVIPGNHDINNHRAARFEGENRLPAEFTTPQEFREIYRNFGYDEAIYRDMFSLSYVYELDEHTWFLMLDTCQYRPMAKVGGAILSDTYDWIENVLDAAWEQDVHVIPVGHHNLLEESEIYVDDCTIEHGEQLVEMLDNWDVSLFLSGHLHVQHTEQAEDGDIWEMVTSSLATPACQYGVLTYWSDGSFSYKTEAVDVEAWAAAHNRPEAELLNFNKFKEPFLRRVFYNQAYDVLKDVRGLTNDQRIRMSNLYSEMNYHYYQGTAYLIKDAVRENPDFELWLEEGAATQLSEYVQYILTDAKWDYNRVEE